MAKERTSAVRSININSNDESHVALECVSGLQLSAYADRSRVSANDKILSFGALSHTSCQGSVLVPFPSITIGPKCEHGLKGKYTYLCQITTRDQYHSSPNSFHNSCCLRRCLVT